ncbi:hypothetical protein ACFL96_20160 [Thermoproteota archaeon]
MTGDSCPTMSSGAGSGVAGGAEGIDYLLSGTPTTGNQPRGLQQYAGKGAGKDGQPMMYVGVRATPEGYEGAVVINYSAMQGKEGQAFSDYLAKGGMSDIISAMLPYANAGAQKAKSN